MAKLATAKMVSSNEEESDISRNLSATPPPKAEYSQGRNPDDLNVQLIGQILRDIGDKFDEKYSKVQSRKFATGVLDLRWKMLKKMG